MYSVKIYEEGTRYSIRFKETALYLVSKSNTGLLRYTLLRNNQPFPDSVRVKAGEELAKFESKRCQSSADQIQDPDSLHALLSTVNTIVADAARPSSFLEGEESIAMADNDIIRFLCVDTCFVRAIRENGASAFTPIRLRQSKDLFYKVDSAYPGFKTDLSFLAR
jgi:hypothetical protein